MVRVARSKGRRPQLFLFFLLFGRAGVQVPQQLVPFLLPFLFWLGDSVPLLKWTTARRYPYSNLSTAGPRNRRGGVLGFSYGDLGG